MEVPNIEEHLELAKAFLVTAARPDTDTATSALLACAAALIALDERMDALVDALQRLTHLYGMDKTLRR